MEETTNPYEIIDQAVAIEINMDTRELRSFTKIRVRVDDPSIKRVKLNCKQLQVDDLKICNVNLYNRKKDKKKKSTLDHHLRSCYQYIKPEDQLNINNAQFKENCFHNIHHFEEASSQLGKFEDEGYLTIDWWFDEDDRYNKELSHIYEMGFKIYFNIDIFTSVVNPQGPASFHLFDNSLVFLKDSTFGSCRNIFPCRDGLGEYYYVSSVKISVHQGDRYKVLSSGAIESITKDPKHNLACYTYNISKVISPSFLGLVIGPFNVQPLSTFAQNVWTLSDQKINTKEYDEIWYGLKKCESFLFSLQDNATNIVLLPSVHRIDFIDPKRNHIFPKTNPYFYYDFFLLSSENFVSSKFLEMKAFILAEFLRYKFLSIVLYNLRLVDVNGLWVFIGVSNYVSDVTNHLSNGQFDYQYCLNAKREKYFELVRHGEDNQPLNATHFYHPNEAYHNYMFNLKSNLLFNMLAANLKLDVENYSSLFMVFHSDLEITTRGFLSKIKSTYRIKGLKKMFSEFLNNTGSIELTFNYCYSRKDNKILMNIKQRPLALEYFQQANKERFALERYYGFISSSNKLVETIKNELRNTIDNYRLILTDRINEEFNSIVLANATRKTINQFFGSIQIILTEANEEDYNSEINTININKREFSISIPLKSRIKKTNNKKNANEQATELNMPQSTVLDNVGEVTEKSSLYNQSMMNVVNYEGGETFTIKTHVDLYNCYLFSIRTIENEEVLIDQFEKGLKRRVDINTLLSILKAMDQNATLNIMNKFCQYLYNKEIPYYIKIEILSILIKKKSEYTLPRVIDVLLSIIQTIKFDKDGTLKPNNFKDLENLEFFLCGLNSLMKYDKSLKQKTDLDDKFQTDDGITHTMLTLLHKNDNSINPSDDSYYQATIIRCLLKVTNSKYFNEISSELLRYFKIEYFNNSKNKYVISVLFKYFAKFVLKNVANMHYYIRKTLSNKFSLMEVFTDNSILKECLDYYLKLKKINKGNISIARIILKQKIIIKERLKGFKFTDTFLYAIKYIKKQRLKYGSILANELVDELLLYLKKNCKQIEELKKKLSLRNIDTIAEVIWSQMSSNFSVVDTRFRYTYMKIYSVFFNEFVPISMHDREKDVLFPLDHYWLEITKRLDFDNYFSKEKKLVTFKYLSLQKKTKKGQIISPPPNYRYNIRDIILQNFKVNKETLTKKNMAKHIINIFLTEKITMKIENEILREEQLSQQNNKGEFTFRIKSNVYSIKEIKKRLAKPDPISLKELKLEILNVVDYFRSKNFIDDDVYAEYLYFTNLLIGEAQKVLKEKKEKEKAKNEDMRIKISLAT